jgi:fucose 4-O-acetylase-like acetyltransferase
MPTDRRHSRVPNRLVIFAQLHRGLVLKSLTVRDPRVDMAKGVLIFLVVFGHLLEAAGHWEDSWVRLFLTFIYMFHMPAFVFLAGFTAKPQKIIRRIGTFAIWLVVFQSVFAAFHFLLGKDPRLSLLVPFWVLWFLMAMIWWTAALPVIVRLRAVAVVVSVLLSIGCGLIPVVGYPLALSGTLVFLPFFVIGTLYGKDLIALASSIPAAAKGALVFVSLAAGGFLYASDISNKWLYGSFNFSDLGISPWAGVGVRAGLLVVAGLATFSFIAIMPSSGGTLTQSGKASLSIYLFHGFVVLAVGGLLPDMLSGAGRLVPILACLAIAALTVAIFTIPVFENSVRWIASATLDPVTARLSRRLVGTHAPH